MLTKQIENKIRKRQLEIISNQLLNGIDSNNYIAMSMAIAEIMHEGQTRVNGEPYVNHPFRCAEEFRKLTGIGEGNINEIKYMNLSAIGLDPYIVQCVSYLHDVIEDTSLSLEEVIYLLEDEENDSFAHKVKEPLSLITHDKSVGYNLYIDECLKHPISAMVKMLDMQDNIRFLDLDVFDSHNYKRSSKYLYYAFVLNQKYNFIEKIKILKDGNL